MQSIAVPPAAAPRHVAEGAAGLLDRAGLHDALQTHHEESYGWALSCCRHRAEAAENVLQLAYLKVLSGKAVFDGKSAFKTWLFAVIRKTAAQEYRIELLQRLRLSRLPRMPAPDPPMPRHGVELQLRDALAKLPARQREVLQLVFYHDLSIAEAAGVMGVSLGSARTHYERGKKQLRRRLA
jgi:RNA polymerase sigma-70 factor, ECF subfamily